MKKYKKVVFCIVAIERNNALQILFGIVKILCNSFNLQYKNSWQEIQRIFLKEKEIKKYQKHTLVIFN